MTPDDDRVVCPACGLEVAAGTQACPVDGAPLDERASRRSGPDLAIDAEVGEYLVRGVIGTGGMGVVYEGVQPMIGKRVAIKVLRREVASVPAEAARLLSEARLVNAIGHRGIIDIFSFGRLTDGRQYLVMELLQGASLHAHIKAWAPLRVPDSLQILDEILAALAAAHGAGVTHRDLKPNNIFVVSQPDGTQYVKLLDFGLAKQSGSSHGEAAQTRVSRVVGTPQFMAPEQARGLPVGPRTDLYALGCIAFEMLTGHLPFTGATAWDVVNQHVNSPPPRPSSLTASVPESVDALVLKLLEKDPAERPSSAEAVRQELKKVRKQLQLSSTRLERFAHPPGEGAPAAARHPAPVPPPVIASPVPEAAMTLPEDTNPAQATRFDRPPHGADLPAPGATFATAVTPLVPTLPNRLPRRALAAAPKGAVALLLLSLVLAMLLLWRVTHPTGTARAPPPVSVPVEPRLPLVRAAPPPVEPELPPVEAAPPPVEASTRSTRAPAHKPAPLSSARAAVLARIELLGRGSPRAGGQPTQIAMMLLADARAQAVAAKTPKQLREVELYLNDWELKFGPEK